MANTKPHWSWSRFDDILSRAARRRRGEDVPTAASEMEETPWLAMSGQTAPSETGPASVEPPHPATGRGHGRAVGTGPKWLNDDTSLYGMADDDSTLKQMDSSTWRRIFGAKRGKRFVAASSTSRWQTTGGSASGKTAATRPSYVGSTWLLQTLFAVVIVGTGWYATHSDSALAAKVDGLYHAAFQTDYSQVTLPAVNDFLAKHHIALPALSQGSGAIHLHPPLAGNVTTDYSSTHPEMFITGTAGESVLAAGSGTVSQVVGSGNDTLVKIDHGSLGSSIYIGLQKVYVKKGDSVSSGQAIGRLPDASQPVLRFAVVRNGLYINPHDYIQFASSRA